MKTILLVAILLVILIVLWSLGPRYILRDAPKQAPSIPDDLDSYLHEKESGISELKPDVQKEILWVHEDKRQTEYAIVYLHGFSSSHKEMSPVFEDVARELGANLYFTRFKGHGSESGELLKTVDRDDWLQDALEAEVIGKRIGRKLIIAGTSHGGLIATWLAAQRTVAEPTALILISPNYQPYDRRTALLLKPWAKQVLPLIFGNHRNWTPQNSAHQFYWNIRYPVHALFPMMAQVDYVTTHSPEKIITPTLVFYSKQDTVVNPTTIEKTFARFPVSKKALVPIEDAGDKDHHIIGGDILSPQTTQKVEQAVLEFIRAIDAPVN